VGRGLKWFFVGVHSFIGKVLFFSIEACHGNKMQPTNPNAHTYVNGIDVETHGYAVRQNTFLQ
jgi:hypothetical protein